MHMIYNIFEDKNNKDEAAVRDVKNVSKHIIRLLHCLKISAGN